MVEMKQADNAFAMPVLGFGTWMMGGNLKRNPANDDEAEVRAIRRAINKGVMHIDTAELYAEGHAEKIIAKAIKNCERSQLFIASKVWSDNLKYDDLIKSAINSLKRLNTEYLDLYYIHGPNRNIPLKETVEAMDTLVRYGLIKNIGVSNFSAELMEEAQSHTKNKIVANQVHYNLVFRRPEVDGVLEYCQKNGVMLVAWRPLQEVVTLAQGVPLLEQMCWKYEKTLAQIAINWLVSQPQVVTISTMRTARHLQDNLNAVNWKMDGEDAARLRHELPKMLREVQLNSSFVFDKVNMMMERPLL
jgi:diketogulonate reductase-like aldo/keto reductase